MKWRGNSYQFAAPSSYDVDAQTWITGVELADGQSLEVAVKDAKNAFVVGCKADGIWTAIKASCVLAGARTLAGALVPLVGPAPTSVNFVSGDYNRKTGLAGNGSTKYLNSNYAIGGAMVSNNHISAFMGASPTAAGGIFGVAPATISGIIDIFRDTSNSLTYYSDYTIGNILGPSLANNTLCGVARSASSSFTARSNNTSSIITYPVVASPPASQTPYIFARNAAGSPLFYTNARLSFYSIGEYLNLALLDARVSALISAYAAAIP